MTTTSVPTGTSTANPRNVANGWPADKVERWPIERLIPYARNARTHSAEQVGQIAASIREWGWTNPVLVAEDGTVLRTPSTATRTIVGHGMCTPDYARAWCRQQGRSVMVALRRIRLAGRPESANIHFGRHLGISE
jgi:hypothetical protein